MKRTEFLTTACSLIGIGFLPSLESCSEPSVNPKPAANFTIDLTSASYTSLKTIGGVVNVQGVFIVRASQSTYIALSQICTHAGCNVNYDSSGKQFVCPCHGGSFDINGNVVSGPPPSALSHYQVTVSGTNLTVAG